MPEVLLVPLPHVVPSRIGMICRVVSAPLRAATFVFASLRALQDRAPQARCVSSSSSPMMMTTHIAEPTPRAAISICAAAPIGADHDPLALHRRDPLACGMVRLRSRSIAEIDAEPRWSGESSLHSTARQRRHANPEQTEDA
jgi:hypothetical protein